jgi:hypothetical protein
MANNCLVDGMRKWIAFWRDRSDKGTMMRTPMDDAFPRIREDFLVWACEQGWQSVPMAHWDAFWQFITPSGDMLYVTFIHNCNGDVWQLESVKKVDMVG